MQQRNLEIQQKITSNSSWSSRYFKMSPGKVINEIIIYSTIILTVWLLSIVHYCRALAIIDLFLHQKHTDAINCTSDASCLAIVLYGMMCDIPETFYIGSKVPVLKVIRFSTWKRALLNYEVFLCQYLGLCGQVLLDNSCYQMFGHILPGIEFREFNFGIPDIPKHPSSNQNIENETRMALMWTCQDRLLWH